MLNETQIGCQKVNFLKILNCYDHTLEQFSFHNLLRLPHLSMNYTLTTSQSFVIKLFDSSRTFNLEIDPFSDQQENEFNSMYLANICLQRYVCLANICLQRTFNLKIDPFSDQQEHEFNSMYLANICLQRYVCLAGFLAFEGLA